MKIFFSVDATRDCLDDDVDGWKPEDRALKNHYHFRNVTDCISG